MGGIRKLLVATAAVLVVLGNSHAPAHPLPGYGVVGAAVFNPGPSGWVSLSISTYVDELGTRGLITIDQDTIQLECGSVYDDDGAFETPTYHLLIAGFRIDGVGYQLWIATYAGDPNPFIQIFRTHGDDWPCNDAGLDGLASARGSVVILG